MSVRRLDPVQPDSFAFTAENMAFAKKTIAQYPAGKQASAVIALMWRAQEQNDGWVSRPAMEYIGEMLDMPFIRVYEVATFYTMFQLSPVGKIAHVQVCGTTPCMLRGANDLKKVCQSKIGAPHHLSADGNFSWEEVECLGACVNAPMVQIHKDTFEDLTPESLTKLLEDLEAGRPVKPGPQNGRQLSAPEGGPQTLTDPELFKGPRKFTRIEAAPPPPPAPAAPAAAEPAKAAAAVGKEPIGTPTAGKPAPEANAASRKAVAKKAAVDEKAPATRSAAKKAAPAKKPATPKKPAPKGSK